MGDHLRISFPDLTQRPPRVLDKARASLQGKAWDYKFGNPMDQQCLVSTGIS